jgi:Na+/H+ antiporter NhaC
MFAGCDLMDHVRTQLPLATVAAVLGGALSTLVLLIGS